MKFFLWFFVGCACVGIPFFIGYDQHDLWNSVFGGMIGGTVFLVLFYSFVVRKAFSTKWKIIIISLFAFHILAFGAFTVTSYRMPTLQRENLLAVRAYSIKMAIEGQIYGRGWQMLHLYYDQPAGREKSFVEVFNTLYGKKIRNGVLFESPEASEGPFVTYQGDSIVQLVIASDDAFSKGIRPDFTNINGQSGKIQYTATMSKHGVTYERNN